MAPGKRNTKSLGKGPSRARDKDLINKWFRNEDTLIQGPKRRTDLKVKGHTVVSLVKPIIWARAVNR